MQSESKKTVFFDISTKRSLDHETRTCTCSIGATFVCRITVEMPTSHVYADILPDLSPLECVLFVNQVPHEADILIYIELPSSKGVQNVLSIYLREDHTSFEQIEPIPTSLHLISLVVRHNGQTLSLTNDALIASPHSDYLE